LAWVESRKGAVPEPTGNRPVSLPRSSNRTCGFATSGFPTGFGATPTAAIPDSDAARQRLGTTTFMLPYSWLKRSSELQRLSDSSSMATPSLRHQHTRSKGPFLRRHYPASTVIRPSPPSESGRHPNDNVGSATSTRPGSPPITQIPFPACRAHYPGGPARCLSVSSLPRGLPRITGGSASTTSLSRPAQASLALQPARSQPAQRRTIVPRLRSGQLPDRTAR